MTRVERWLQISMASVATVATILLGVGQRNALLPALGLFTGVTSVLFTDVLGWLRLDRRISYGAMILAAVFSLNGYWRNTSEEQLLAIANMLVFVQVALLYQEKSLRIYSHLAVFSVLQVVVAALLNVGFEFGVLLIAYLALGFFALSLFYLHREAERLAFREAAHQPAASTFDTEWRLALGGPPRVRQAEPASATGDRVLSSGFVRHIGAIFAATLLFAAFYFYFAPRNDGLWSRYRGTRRSVVGFSNKVRLNDLGDILQSNELVMRVEFSRLKSGERYSIAGEPYFRGAVMTHYYSDDDEATWHYQDNNPGPLPASSTAPRQDSLVKVEFKLEPSRHDTLFHISPSFRLPETPLWMEYGVSHRTFTRREVNQDDRLRMRNYALATSAFGPGDSQQQITPHRERGSHAQELTPNDRQTLTNFDPFRFPTIQAVSDQLMAEAGDESSRVLKCQTLMNYLRSDRFRYTLNFAELESKQDRNVDPIEDFFANHRQGHCQYFASALTMMLRSQNIPARLVVGFKGGDYNTVGRYYQVRSRHAHSWVEAYLEPEDIPLDSRGERLASGGWLRLDPTPSAAQEEFNKGMMAYVDHVLDYSRLIWDEYVMGLNQKRQSELYAPVRSRNRNRLGKALGFDVQQWAADQLPDWSKAVLQAIPAIALTITLLLVGIVAVVRVVRPGTINGWSASQQRARGRTAPLVDFYERFERCVRAAGFVRQETQTQQEFAAMIAARLQQTGEASRAAEAAERIAAAFYRVRFGGRPLDSAEADAIERAITVLGEAVALYRREAAKPVLAR